MKVAAYGLLVAAFMGVALGQCPTTPPDTGGRYFTDVRLVDTKKNSLQVWLTEGDQTVTTCVEMKTNRNTVYELECCDVCYVLTEWLTGFEEQYADKLTVEEDAGGQYLAWEHTDPEGEKRNESYRLKPGEYVDPDLYFYFSAPFDTEGPQNDETRNIYVFTSGTAGGDEVTHVLSLDYANGVGGVVDPTSRYTDINSPDVEYSPLVFQDWNMDMSGMRLGCFSEPFIGFSIPVYDNDVTNSCFRNATVQYSTETSTGKFMTLDILNYDVFVAPDSGDHNPRAVSWDFYGRQATVYYPNQDALTFTFQDNPSQIIEVAERGERCDIFGVPSGDQCG